ncbi:MAG TPA: hypothetical protein VK974_07150 [Methylophilaceae bacterium]|nr:hypothetical protein [Methylophilaceae bacterium]
MGFLTIFCIGWISCFVFLLVINVAVRAFFTWEANKWAESNPTPDHMLTEEGRRRKNG